ncbi:Sorting nexin-16 [Mactra antiquata]
MEEDGKSDLTHDPLGVGQVDAQKNVQNEVAVNSSNNADGTPRRSEPKVSLSEYHTRSLSSSGAETDALSNNDVLNHDLSESANVSLRATSEETVPKTSTPLRTDLNINPVVGTVGFSPVENSRTRSYSTVTSTGSTPARQRSSTGTTPTRQRVKRVSFVDPLNVRVPLVGFEVMEQRAKFTVFKLHVHKGKHDNWFVFRRYSDFVQLQESLHKLFPMFRIPLPPKRWFRNNYEKEFIEDRMLGLQAFVDSILCHTDLCNSVPVQEFFCFSDPPGPHDSVEESRAYCDELEQSVYNLRKQLHSKDTEIEILRDELNLYKSQVEMLTKALRDTNASGATNGIGNNGITELSLSCSLAECDLMAPEADQSKPMSLKDEINQSELARLKALRSEMEGVKSAPRVLEVSNTVEYAKKDNSSRKSSISRFLQIS